MARWHNALASALLVAAVACGDDSMEPEMCTAETGSVTASVDVSGTAPVFSWDPDCAVAWLLVEEGSSDVWFIESSPTQANLISPPITFGATSLPAGVQTSYGPDPLVRGTSYELILAQVVDPAVTACTELVGDLCRLVVHHLRGDVGTVTSCSPHS